MNPFLNKKAPLHLRALRKLIRAGSKGGFIGTAGAWIGRNYGWPLYGGAKLQIDDPCEFIQSMALTFGAYEPNIAFLIFKSLSKGDLFVDVGGNIGNHTLIAAKAGAQVITLEPLQRLASRIDASLKLNAFSSSVEIVSKAAGESEGTALLHIAKRGDDGSHSLIPGVQSESPDTITVPVTTLDKLCRERQILPSLIKVDVEGFEAKVIDGARELMTSNTPPCWIVETADRLADSIGESAQSVANRFFARGYVGWRISETGLAEPLNGTLPGDLMNYCFLHSKSVLRPILEQNLKMLAFHSP